MKTLKYTYILILFTFSNCSQGQIRNELSQTEYTNIKINGISWVTIENTKGNVDQMKALFGSNITIKTGEDPSLMIHFWDSNKGFYFRFEENDPNIVNDYVLVNFRISNPSSNITIQGKTVTIGDNISKLGSVKINKIGTDIVFGTTYSDDTLILKFDLLTQNITSIEYISFD